MPKSVMVHSFSEVPRAEIPRSSFDRSHGLKTTFDADLLVPILVDDIIPGDTFNVNCSFVARLASPTILPLMDNMFLETFFFFVPYRLIWENWERFCGAQDDPGDVITFTVPVIAGAVVTPVASLGDYMGLPLGVDADSLVTCSSLPFRAYYLIWDDWFRDQNLQDGLDFAINNGPDGTLNANSCLKRGKRHDYFTSCLPWPQKGTAVSLPLQGNAIIHAGSGLTPGGNESINVFSDDQADERFMEVAGTNLLHLAATGDENTDRLLYADLSSATAATINQLRLAFQTQRLLERDARAGTRYVEHLLAHYGVTSPDFRLQRPEFLGGGSSRIQVSPVAQTTYQGTQTIEDSKGALAGIGTVSGNHSWTKSFVEHGVIIGLANVRGDITYSQGIDRYWDKQTRFDFFYPVLAQIGEQSVLNREIWFTDTASIDNAAFGYQERYAEYRYKPSRLSSLMRPDAAGTLAAFHLSEDFATLPSLGAAFITSNTEAPLDRALSVPSQPHFVADFYFSMKCARPMPLFGVPGNLDRF